VTGQDIVLVLGAYSAFVLAAFGLLIKFVLDTRRATTETNKAVNNRPDSQPTLRTLVEELHLDMSQMRRDSDRRHGENVERIHRLSDALRRVESDLKSHMRDMGNEDQ